MPSVSDDDTDIVLVGKRQGFRDMLGLRNIDRVGDIVSQGAWLRHRMEWITRAIGEEGSHDGGGRLIADEDRVSMSLMDLFRSFLLFIFAYQVDINFKNERTYCSCGHCQPSRRVSHSAALYSGMWQGEPRGTVLISRPSMLWLNLDHASGEGQQGSAGRHRHPDADAAPARSAKKRPVRKKNVAVWYLRRARALLCIREIMVAAVSGHKGRPGKQTHAASQLEKWRAGRSIKMVHDGLSSGALRARYKNCDPVGLHIHGHELFFSIANLWGELHLTS